MRITFARQDEGQALVVVAIAMVVLMGAIALAVDWGYGYASRRGLQNDVDAATLAAARRVISTRTASTSFEATLEEVCNDVSGRTARVAAAGGTVNVSFFSEATAGDPSLWTTVPTSACAARSGQAVPPATVFVRVEARVTYTSLFSVVTRQPLVVAASARARLTGVAGCSGASCAGLRQLQLPQPEVPGTGISGATTAPNVAMWPLAFHLDIGDYSNGPCGQYCNVTGRRNVLWPSDQFGTSSTRFTGLVTLSHFSPREQAATARQVHQIITESDYTGTDESAISTRHNHLPLSGTVPNGDPRACGGAPSWDTLGAPDLGTAASCDLPNWFRYGFRGSVGIGTDWTHSSWDAFENDPGLVDDPEPLPEPVSGRASCATSIYMSRPSCANSSLGDWVETVPGDLTGVMVDQMLRFVQEYGRDVPNSGSLGKAVVVHVLLWDCAERFDPTQSLGSATRWDILMKGRGGDPDDDDADCSKLKGGVARTTTIDRVHIAAAVPFTIYEGLIWTGSTPRVEGYWGDVFADPGVCSADPTVSVCALNPLMNSAFLVPDE